MKALRILTLAALIVSTLALGAAQAVDHPKKAEHPASKEHPAKTEHPATGNDLLAVATKAGQFKTFLAAVEAADLTDKFRGEGPYTVFAPTDEAFAKLPEGMLEDLLKPANRSRLAGLLGHHVVPGMLMSADVKTMKATNFGGQDLAITVSDGAVTVDGCHVIKADYAASNGVIHAIDQVMIPAPPEGHSDEDAPKDHPAH
jgi:uncharacterized surface protein with fasciclin (FAS1) repeats